MIVRKKRGGHMIKQIQTFLEQDNIFTKSIKLLISLLVLYIVALVISLIVNKVLFGRSEERVNKQSQTLKGVINSTIKFITYFFMLVMILTFIGVDISSIVAVAGIGSVALGFGAQTLVKDVISGIFILLEDQFQVDDIITLEGFTGRVEAINLRITTLRNSLNNEVYIIPNGQITIVTNKTKDFQKINFSIKLQNTDKIESIRELAEVVVNNFSLDQRIISPITIKVYYDDIMPIIKLNVACSVLNGQTIPVRRELTSALIEMLNENKFERYAPISVVQEV